MPCPPPGDLPDPGIKSRPPALQADFLPSELLGSLTMYRKKSYTKTKGIYTLVILTPPEEGNFCVPLEVASGDEDGVLMERGEYTPI